MESRSRRSRRRSPFSRLRRELRRVPLADRCLLLIFFLLLLQSAAVLFCPFLGVDGEIDVIVRTSAASIFGYLLGGGVSGEDPLPDPEVQPDRTGLWTPAAWEEAPKAAAAGAPSPAAPASVAPASADPASADPASAAPAPAAPASVDPAPADPASAATAWESPALPLSTASPRQGCSRFRILTAAGIGLFCLLSLLLLRDWPGMAASVADSPGGTAIVVQFRDFIAGSLGFLTGCSSRSGGDSPP